MANKNRTGGTFVFGLIGLVFIVLGIFLFSSPLGNVVTTVIAVIDVLFGAALLIGAFAAPGKNAAEEEDYFEQQEDMSYVSEQPRRSDVPSEPHPAPSSGNPYFDDDLNPAEDIPSEPVDLAARENELRIAAKRAAENATRAKKVATTAVQEAKQAEEKLRRAEESLARLEPAEQRAAMRKIDMLAQVAAEKSEIAVNEAKRAKLAIRNAREAAELHSAAMDAAASAISVEDEFAEFN